MSRSSKPLPAASLHLMLALLDGELHGYALMKRVGELSDGAVVMGPGTLYGTLNRLVDGGLIVETTDRRPRDDGERRRYYELTANGRLEAVDELQRLTTLVQRVGRHLPRAVDVSDRDVAERAYEALVRLYPRRFRDEYGADMVDLFRELCRDEPLWRTGPRVLADLAVTIPSQHLEVHMRRNPTPLVAAVYLAVASAGALLAAVSGSQLVGVALGLTIAVVAGTLGVTAWRRSAPVRDPGASSSWWRFLLAGPTLLGSVIGGAALGIEAWYLGMVTAALAIVLTATGCILGLAQLLRGRSHPAAL